MPETCQGIYHPSLVFTGYIYCFLKEHSKMDSRNLKKKKSSFQKLTELSAWVLDRSTSQREMIRVNTE